MNTRVPTAPLAGIFKRVTFRETALLLAVAWLVPLAVHLLPWTGAVPLGAHLLPMFWTAFVAVYLYGLRVGLLVGLFAPALSLVLTGQPALQRLALMGFEITVFVAFAWWGVRRRSAWWLVAPLGYLVAKLSATVLLTLGGAAAGLWAGMPASLLHALPGLMVLAAVNLALVRLYPKSDGPRGDDAAGL